MWRRLIGKSLEADVELRASEPTLGVLRRHAEQLPALFIVSDVQLAPADAPLPHGETVDVRVTRARGARCARCWRCVVAQTVANAPPLCARCAAVVASLL